ncbi:unnamed protein product, partial [marine sediment metagenome]
SIQCKVTDAQDHIGEVVWNDFVVSQISQTDVEKNKTEEYGHAFLKFFPKQSTLKLCNIYSGLKN